MVVPTVPVIGATVGSMVSIIRYRSPDGGTE